MSTDRGLRFARRAIKVEEALQRIQQHVSLMEIEEVPLAQSVNRRVAETIYATIQIPHFARSGMDGYAVRSEDAIGISIEQPCLLRIIDSVAAGDLEGTSLLPGTAVRIMTGAPVPMGASAVVMLEQTEDVEQKNGRYVKLKHPVQQGQNISYPGEEIRNGQLLFEKGTKLQPGQIALLATFGYSTVKVFRKPRVGIIATGSELILPEKPIEYGKIRNSNTSMLAAQVHHFGGIAFDYGMIPDDFALASQIITQAEADMDMVITTGGVSVGDYDIMVDIFKNVEDHLLFNKVAMRPGSPTTVACKNGKFLFGLSGNPGACFVGFELFVRPVLLNRLGGRFSPRVYEAILACDFEKGSPHERYVRGQISYENGMVKVRPLGANKSSMMVSIQEANVLIVIPPGKTGASRGQLVKFIPLEYET